MATTPCNYSPLQLYSLYSIGSELFTEDNAIDPSTYGVDASGPWSLDSDDLPHVVVPETNIELSENSVETLEASISPTQDSDCYSADIFMQTVTLVNQLMENDDLIQTPH